MKKKFYKVNIEISNICNLQCSFCPEVVRSKKMMPVELFEKIIAQLQGLTEQVCFHLMGEPLVHPQLPQLVEICHKYQMPVFFVSNGVLLRPHLAEPLLHPTIRQVNFSLHSFFDNHPGKDPSTYLEKIFEFTEKAFQQRPDLYVNYRLWNLNDPRGSLTDNTEMLQKIQQRFDFKDHLDLDVRFRKSLRIKNRLYLHYDTEFVWPDLEQKILGTEGFCYGLSSHFGILVDGTVVPCCLDKEGKIPLGNVASEAILDILNNSQAQQILQGFKKRQLINPLCQRCNYIERFSKTSTKSATEVNPDTVTDL